MDAEYQRYAEDSVVLAQLGDEFAAAGRRVTIRVPTHLAKQALAAWSRDETEAAPASESVEQYLLRHRAATLALIGQAIEDTGRPDGEAVIVELDVVLVGSALDTADELAVGDE